MLIEAKGGVGAENGEHTKDRKTYFAGGPEEEDGYTAWRSVISRGYSGFE
jgi:hypothetical protein